MENRVMRHPVLGDAKEREIIHFTYNGKPLEAYEGESVAAALIANGIRVFRHSSKKHEYGGDLASAFNLLPDQ